MASNFTGGGGFLLGRPERILTAEAFSDQQQLIAQTAEEFAQNEIAPAAEAIERKDFHVTRELLRKAGELGLTGVDVPEAYGGMGMDFIASAIVADHLAVEGSFSVSFGAHVGIATLPLVHFGSESQKQSYLPRLAKAEWVGAYALSEAGSGSDALAMRTEARRSEDGRHFTLEGEKMWISNAGFADLFTVFAKLEGQVTAFLVERSFPGVETGPEESKMGIHGSSTRALLLRQAKVPAENLLGGPGEGKRIAFQTLNLGRFKLGAACVGGARNLLRLAARYAHDRHAFGKPLEQFGLMQQMLAEMAVRLWGCEAAVYRTAEYLASSHDLDEYATECALVKVAASEMLDYVVDAAVQIHGGNGFVHGNPAERAYRDARVNRIFEGTNEINRLLASGMLLRRAAKGVMALRAAIEAVREELLGPPTEMEPSERARKATLLITGLAYEKHGAGLAEEEELLACLSDLMIATYVLQAAEARDPNHAMTRVLAYEMLERTERQGRQALAYLQSGDALRSSTAWLRRLLRHEPADVWRLRREIAHSAAAAAV